MRPESRRLAKELLDHHRRTTAAKPPTGHVVAANYTIPYSTLVNHAGVPHVLRIVGNFLQEVAEWCSENDWPPLNSLAVNASTGIPGEGYDLAGGYLANNWQRDVVDCIQFKGYPAAPP
jgi:hypothetical protein